MRVEIGDRTEGWIGGAVRRDPGVGRGPRIPRPLVRRSKGVPVLPIGDRDEQVLVRLRRTPDGMLGEEYLGNCRFVELKGVYGWSDG
jgi:protein-L-isoaspartate(D-aspartate) O-methyltransferase